MTKYPVSDVGQDTESKGSTCPSRTESVNPKVSSKSRLQDVQMFLGLCPPKTGNPTGVEERVGKRVLTHSEITEVETRVI